MSLRARLAAKARRHELVPVQVSDPAADRARAAEARALALSASLRGVKGDDLVRLESAADEAEAALEAHFEIVDFQALDPNDFEALIAAHTTPDGAVDQGPMRVALAAACVVDEELQDEAFWAEQFASGAWSKGELDHLYYRLFSVLNYSVPGPALPKD